MMPIAADDQRPLGLRLAQQPEQPIALVQVNGPRVGPMIAVDDRRARHEDPQRRRFLELRLQPLPLRLAEHRDRLVPDAVVDAGLRMRRAERACVEQDHLHALVGGAERHRSVNSLAAADRRVLRRIDEVEERLLRYADVAADLAFVPGRQYRTRRLQLLECGDVGELLVRGLQRFRIGSRRTDVVAGQDQQVRLGRRDGGPQCRRLLRIEIGGEDDSLPRRSVIGLVGGETSRKRKWNELRRSTRRRLMSRTWKNGQVTRQNDSKTTRGRAEARPRECTQRGAIRTGFRPDGRRGRRSDRGDRWRRGPARSGRCPSPCRRWRRDR